MSGPEERRSPCVIFTFFSFLFFSFLFLFFLFFSRCTLLRMVSVQKTKHQQAASDVEASFGWKRRWFVFFFSFFLFFFFSFLFVFPFCSFCLFVGPSLDIFFFSHFFSLSTLLSPSLSFSRALSSAPPAQMQNALLLLPRRRTRGVQL